MSIVTDHSRIAIRGVVQRYQMVIPVQLPKDESEKKAEDP